MDSNHKPATDEPQTLVFHLMELRSMLLRVFLAVFGVFIVLMPFGRTLFTWVSQPLVEQLSPGATMVAIDVISPFLTPFKLSFFTALFVTMPYILYQFWGFVAPGLYQREKRTAVPLLITSIILFYAGIAFVYFVVFPLLFAFIVNYAPETVAVTTDITRFFDFMIMLCLTFGLAFEVPIAIVILVWMGITTPDKLAAKRPFVLIGAFVLGMFLTPPDVISQILLAIPMYILYEFGLFMARRMPLQQDSLAPGDTPN
ncbi:MAG: twin-arginine translocase subunit TatC [Gammaproteobacteria bacterium]|nr:twin-arginine translocase subunit TatC [Gammaproteobacteria bacterium]